VGYLPADRFGRGNRSPSREFAKDAEQVLQELFFDPKASREYARDAYLVQAGNIYVNQVRLTGLIIALKDPGFLTQVGNTRSNWPGSSCCNTKTSSSV
jgi:hypothetical protein